MINQETLRTAVTLMSFAAVGLGGYVTIKTQATEQAMVSKAIVEKVENMANYQEAMWDEIMGIKEDTIRMDAELKGSIKSYDKLAGTIDNLSKEMNNLNKTLIRLEK